MMPMAPSENEAPRQLKAVSHSTNTFRMFFVASPVPRNWTLKLNEDF